MNGVQALSLHAQFLSTLEHTSHVDQRVLGSHLLGYAKSFAQKRWLVPQGHVTHILVPVLDSEEEVEVWVDEVAQTYGYDCPAWRGRKVVRPLEDLRLYVFNPDLWLDELTALMGIEPARRSRRRTLVEWRLWHLGDVRIAGTHDFAPVFVGCKFRAEPTPEVGAALRDPIWPRGGVVLRHSSTVLDLPGEHVARCLSDFVRSAEDGTTVFEGALLNRVLQGYVSPATASEPEQFLKGKRLKLPHFKQSREMAAERAKIIKALWGDTGRAAPQMTWAEVNELANTGYQSFDDAFGGVKAREDVIEKMGRAKYRIRRNP